MIIQIFSNKSIYTIDRTLTSTTTPDLSGPRSNSDGGLLHTPGSPKTSPPDALKCQSQGTPFLGKVLFLLEGII